MSGDAVGGAVFLGLNKVLVKAHGASKATAFSNAIIKAADMAERDVPAKISQGLALCVEIHRRRNRLEYVARHLDAYVAGREQILKSELYVEGFFIASGEGGSKRAAEQESAKAALRS